MAQLFVAQYPERVRSLLLTNCDVDENTPPELFMPVAKLAQKGLFVDRMLAPELKDLQLARLDKGCVGLYVPGSALRGDYRGYLGPLVASSPKKQQTNAYGAAYGLDAGRR